MCISPTSKVDFHSDISLEYVSPLRLLTKSDPVLNGCCVFNWETAESNFKVFGFSQNKSTTVYMFPRLYLQCIIKRHSCWFLNYYQNKPYCSIIIISCNYLHYIADSFIFLYSFLICWQRKRRWISVSDNDDGDISVISCLWRISTVLYWDKNL